MGSPSLNGLHCDSPRASRTTPPVLRKNPVPYQARDLPAPPLLRPLYLLGCFHSGPHCKPTPPRNHLEAPFPETHTAAPSASAGTSSRPSPSQGTCLPIRNPKGGFLSGTLICWPPWPGPRPSSPLTGYLTQDRGPRGQLPDGISPEGFGGGGMTRPGSEGQVSCCLTTWRRVSFPPRTRVRSATLSSPVSSLLPSSHTQPHPRLHLFWHRGPILLGQRPTWPPERQHGETSVRELLGL